MDQLVCLGVPPAPVYKGSRGGGRPASMARQGGVLLLVGVGVLLGGGLLLGAPLGPAGLLPLILYIRGQGGTPDTQVDPRDHILSRVRCPLPP